MMVSLLAGYTIGSWIQDGLIAILPSDTPALAVVFVKLTAMLGFARWFRSLLRKSLPVEVGEIKEYR